MPSSSTIVKISKTQFYKIEQPKRFPGSLKIMTAPVAKTLEVAGKTVKISNLYQDYKIQKSSISTIRKFWSVTCSGTKEKILQKQLGPYKIKKSYWK